MTTQRTVLNGGWTDLQGGDGDGAAADTATIDPINILDTVEVPIVVLRRDLMVACFNKAAADVLGLSPSDIGRTSCDRSALAGLHRLEEQCRQVIAGGMESRADFRDGYRWFVVQISPYARGDGQVTGVVLTFTNVTAFRASVDQAIYEREFTKAILNTAAGPLVVLSADQRVQSANRAFYTMFGLSRDEAQGIPLRALGRAAFELAQLHGQLAEMLAGSRAFHSVEVDHVVTGKGERTLVLDAHPLFLPGHSERRVLVTFQDITSRKQAEAAKDLRSEEELRRSEAFLAEAQRLSLTGSFSWRVATDEITGSDQLYRIFEFEQGVQVTLELIVSRIHPEDLPLFGDMVDRARGARADFDFEYRLQMPDHSVKYLHVIAHGTRDSDDCLEYIGAAQDVTQRRLSEEALRRSERQLQQVEMELAHANRVAAMGQMSTSIAHEVNQPVAAAITNAHVALHWLDSEQPEKVRQALNRTIKSGNRASEVIDRIRAFIKKTPPRMDSLEVNDAILEVIALTRSEAVKNGISVQTQLAEGLPVIQGDRVQLQQVVLNLIINALEAISGLGEGARELMISTGKAKSDGVFVAVRDSGPGVSPTNLERVFEAFYTTKSDGLGMGLSICRSIIEAHGGRLWATASEPQGAIFEFTLPTHPDSPS
ncbi:ATP-binding protein [Allomesorhizobium camelthorni]|uniref:histidine kinase n=1 Tax=Allomesorhizobium camelthorni TaxID=475069 RepID=A0A6G4WLT4_9HYPH|nr:ATP-binding protein [Mesorhizobium camelthorni]NGO55318.1 PAS domain-containing protein [Mesorhizobium camelthorni]